MREMVDSGIEWLKSVPFDWKIMRHRYIMHKKKEICAKYNGEDIISLSMKGVIKRDLNAGGKFPSTFDGYQYVHPGELLLCLFDIDVTPRCSGFVRDFGVTSPAYSKFIVHQGFHAPYYNYLLTALDNDKVFVHLSKNLRYSLTEDDFGLIPTLVPPLAEQFRIAVFLDERCAKIDEAVARHDAIIKKLDEYRKAVITQAVTKGVRGEREMKESGVDWIGRIPSEWSVKRGKFVLTLLNRPTVESDGVITCFRDGEVTLRSRRREEGFTFAIQEAGYQGIEPGDLVIHKMDGFAGAIGVSDSRGKGTPALNVMDSTENKDYLKYFFRAVAFLGYFESIATGIRVRTCDTGWPKIQQTPCLLPPQKEQSEIVTFLDEKCAAIDAAKERHTQLMAKLEEYKKSLIYYAVTGKIEC